MVSLAHFPNILVAERRSRSRNPLVQIGRQLRGRVAGTRGLSPEKLDVSSYPTRACWTAQKKERDDPRNGGRSTQPLWVVYGNANEHWAVTAQVSGLITCDNLDVLEGEKSGLPQEMHLRDIPDEQLIRIWRAVVRGDTVFLLRYPWMRLSDLPSYVQDYYRAGA